MSARRLMGYPGHPAARWAQGARALATGADPAEACRCAGLSGAEVARLVPRWAGGWVDLLDDLEGADILVVDRSPGRAGLLLAAVARTVGFAEDHAGRAWFRRALLADHPARALVGPLAELPAPRGRWDLIVLEGTTPDRRVGLPMADRMVIVADNPLSPLRALDRLRSRPAGRPAKGTLEQLCRRAERYGLGVRQRFGLLRSSAEPVTAFDLDAPEVVATVLRSGGAQVRDLRHVALGALGRLAATRAPELLCPGWMVVSSRGDPAVAGQRPTGRIGSWDSEEAKIVRGSPPAQLEKIYSSPGRCDNEWWALERLARCGFDLAPRPVRRLGPARLRQQWIRGAPLAPYRLRAGELATWTAASARVLGRLQRATAGRDGSVLVHGDFWLGNVLVDGTKVVGVVDWTEAHRGGPEEDLRHLVETAAQLGRRRGVDVPELMRRARHERSVGAAER